MINKYNIIYMKIGIFSDKSLSNCIYVSRNKSGKKSQL